MKTLLRNGFLATVALALGLVSVGYAAAQDGPPQGQGRGQFAGMQRVVGTVTAVSGDALTVKSEDGGTTYQVTTTPNTRVMKGQAGQMAALKVADLKAGDTVTAAGNMDVPNKTLHAALVFVVDAEQIKKLRENLGKTYIAGRVTAIDADNLKMTVKRADGVEQVIGFDETTSFKRGRGGRGMMGGGFAMGGSEGGGGASGGGRAGTMPEGESITLADIKVGDTVGGQGSVKSGTFVPTQLMVSTPRAPGEGRRGNGAAPPPQQ